MDLAKSDIENYFAAADKKIYKLDEIRNILLEKRDEWRLTSSIKFKVFIDFLVNTTKLEKVNLSFNNRPALRFVWGNVPIYEFCVSLKESSFLSHYTASFLNELTEYEPNDIYVNSEQPRKSPKGVLTQEAIDLAFKGSGRVSRRHAAYKGRNVWLINSMGEGEYGVEERIDSTYGKIRVTNLERTLLDMTVRPHYSGGVSEVLKAYIMAKGKISLEYLANYLRKLDFVYPYHQAIGFYLEKAGGYSEKQLGIFREFELYFDFYLAYKMEETFYSKKWRIFYPANL
jgi:hypothetical protein